MDKIRQKWTKFDKSGHFGKMAKTLTMAVRRCRPASPRPPSPPPPSPPFSHHQVRTPTSHRPFGRSSPVDDLDVDTAKLFLYLNAQTIQYCHKPAHLVQLKGNIVVFTAYQVQLLNSLKLK